MYHFLVWHLLQPFPWLCVLPFLIAIYLRRTCPDSRRRISILVVASGALVVFCLPLTAWLALGTLEWRYPPLRQRPPDVQAIVVLASSVRPPTPAHPNPEPDDASHYRCLRAAEVYHDGPPCPVIVSGAYVDSSEPDSVCAQAMRQLLIQLQVNPRDLVFELHSRTTRENASESARLLKERNLHKVIVITNTDHLPRAAACFRKLGFDVVPCGCHFSATKPDNWILELVPTPSAARLNQAVCHEWIGLVWYWWNGWI
jgi:uncharacterized SAM-binding protein YcdF (DUF218 family)